ncbi:MAG: ABC transporter permease [Bacillota bacterium]
MRRYLTITKNSTIAGMIYRVHYLFTVFANIMFIVLTYFLWKAIYKNSDGTLNGMTFEEVFIYLALASSITCLFQTWTEYDMSRNILSGAIIRDLTKPLDHQMLTLFGVMGFVANNLVTITLPSMVLIYIIAGSHITLGFNILFFALALFLAFLITFTIDYSIGLVSFYTESIWGVSITKGVIIGILSGAVIPLNFFPGALRSIVELLPFQAIYNTPLTILLSKDMGVENYIYLIVNQIFWVVVLFTFSRLFYRKAVKVITVNGG